MGVLIALEGIDGSGKTTIGQRLVEAIRRTCMDAVLTREPGGTVVGERIREILLDSRQGAVAPETEALLFAAARAQHLTEVIKPALEQGKVVIVDRYVDSSLAYQWGGRGLKRHHIGVIQELATGGLAPDFRLLFDLPVEQALRRRLADGAATNRLDLETRQFFERVRAAYRTLMNEDPGTWRVIDAEQGPEEVWQQVVAALNDSDLLSRPIH